MILSKGCPLYTYSMINKGCPLYSYSMIPSKGCPFYTYSMIYLKSLTLQDYICPLTETCFVKQGGGAMIDSIH